MDNESNNTFNAINCEHVYIDDYIDTMFPYREGILITYCEICGLSKKYIEKLKNDYEKIEKNGNCITLNKEKLEGRETHPV